MTPPLDPTYNDPFYKPRKASRLERLRYRVWQRVEAWAAKRAEADDGIRIGGFWDVPDDLLIQAAADPAAAAVELERIRRAIADERSVTNHKRRVLLLAVALAMAGCGAVVGAWIIGG